MRVEGGLDPAVEGHDVRAELGLERAALSRPTPCSPVIVPPSPIAAAMIVVEGEARPALGVGVAGRVDDRRVGVAVAGVRHDRDLHGRTAAAMSSTAASRAGSWGTGTPTSSGSTAPRASMAREVQAAGLHEQLALVGVVGGEDLLGPGHARRRGGHDGDLVGPGGARGVGLDEEQGTGIAVQAHRPEVLDGVDRGAVHELDHRGAHGAAELDDRGGRGGDGREGRDDRRARVLRRDQAQDRPGDDAEGALGADEELEQREARRRP